MIPSATVRHRLNALTETPCDCGRSTPDDADEVAEAIPGDTAQFPTPSDPLAQNAPSMTLPSALPPSRWYIVWSIESARALVDPSPKRNWAAPGCRERNPHE